MNANVALADLGQHPLAVRRLLRQLVDVAVLKFDAASGARTTSLQAGATFSAKMITVTSLLKFCAIFA